MIRKLLFSLVTGLLITVFANGQAPVASFTTTSATQGCGPLIINFQSTSTPGATLLWNFGGNPPDVSIATSTSATPVVVFNTAGTYSVTLKATDANGSTTSVPMSIVVYPSPVADFSTPDSVGCSPFVVHLFNNSNPGAGATIASQTWYFPGGDTSNLSNPVYTFSLPGNYAINLQVINNFGCKGSASLKTKTGYITVTPGVIANFNDSLSGNCNPPTNAFFSNQTSGPGAITYTWRFGDGGSSNAVNPNHIYAASGNFNVSLTASSSSGCTDSTSVPIFIPSGSLTSSFVGPDSICINALANFQNTSSPIPNNSIWTFGDGGTANTPNASHTYTAAGTYRVTLQNGFSSCNDSTSKVIHVFNPPVPNFVALTSTTSCKTPFTVNFQDQSTNATNWLWDFGDGTTGTGPNPSHTYNKYGYFTVTLTSSNASGCSNQIKKANLVQVAQPAVHITNLPAYGCAPLTFTPTVVDTVVDGIASYAWNMGNGNTYNVQTPPAQVYGGGTYLVSLTVTSNGGCTASVLDTVKVGTIKPTANFMAAPVSVCVASPVSFTDQSTGGANQWKWDFGDGTTDVSENPNHKFSTPGTYTITLTAYNNGCFDVKTINAYIKVLPPLSNFTFSFNCSAKNVYNFKDASTGAQSWDWDFGDGSAHDATPNPSHTYPNTPGTYTVTLTTTNTASGCSNTVKQSVNVLQGINFTDNATATCRNSTVTFSAPINNNIKFYTFDFGDGSPRTGPCYCSNASHVYNTPGIYNVTLITTDSLGCLDSVSKKFSVNGPVANFGTPVQKACNSLNALFTDSSVASASPIKTWLWDFGDTSTSSTPSPNHLYTKQGIFPVKLKVTDAAGCSDSLVKPSYITLSVPNPSFTTPDSLYCPSSLIKFTNTSTGGFNPTYVWDFGNGKTYSGTNPPLQNFAAIGQFTIQLKMTDMYGCSATYTKNNYINIDTPNANFSLSATTASCPPLNEQFTYLGHYAKSVLWNFGPGIGVSDLKNPSNLYGLPGTYWPSLTVTSPGGCIAVDSQKIVISGPVGKFTYAPNGGCDSLTVNFNVATSGVVGYVWYFGNGDSVANTSPSITYKYNFAGNFLPVVHLIDTSNCNVAYPGSVPIIVDSIKAKFVTNKSVLCTNGDIAFKDTSYKGSGTLITNYYWNFGDGSVVNGLDSMPNHFFATPGLYNVKLIVTTQFGCSDSVVNQIKVVASPSIGINGIVPQCAPANLTLTGVVLVPDTSALSWSWDFDNGQTSLLQNPPAQVYPKAGQYNIKLTVTNSSGCVAIDSSLLQVFPVPTINGGPDTTICLGQSTQLQANGGLSYTWLPPSNTSLSCTACFNPVATPNVTTDYYVTGTSANGCTATDTVTVTVNQPVTVTANPTLDSVCIGKGVQLSASGAALYTWTPAAGLSNPSIANPVASPTATTVYQVIGSDSKMCFFDTASVQVTVFNYPSINLGPDATLLVGSSYQIPGTGSPDIVSITWSPLNTLDFGACAAPCAAPLATPQKTTTYIATATNNGNCSLSDSLKITVICNNNNFFVPNTFSPNGDGVNDRFFIQGKGINIIPSITIFNRWGQIVFQKKDFAPNDPSAGWDGTFNGKPAPVDVYVYTIEIICDNSTLIPYHGNVTLIR
ncbi:MAG: hypothetical protein C5B59_10095 [Bacteroidetes bacterium]|nr:MAG: hypothetical protein C5B59_10095 [Bacteroidota bacterium]